MSTYRGLGTDEQVAVLRRVAEEALREFGLEGSHLDLVLHEYNTTFVVVDPQGRRFALRVNTNSKSTPGHIVAQQSWLQSMAGHPELRVPEPRRTRSGQWWVSVPCQAWGDDVRVSVASWLEGEEVEEFTPEVARALGGTMASLHVHSRQWVLPQAAELPRFTDPLFGDRDVLGGVVAQEFSPADRALVDTAQKRCASAFAAVGAAHSPIPIHAACMPATCSGIRG